MTTNHTIPAADALSGPEAAALIGVNHATLWRWTRAGHVPGVAAYAGRYIYDRNEIVKFGATRIDRTGIRNRIKKAAA